MGMSGVFWGRMIDIIEKDELLLDDENSNE